MDFPRAQVAWAPSHRLVPSRFPPKGLLDRVAGDREMRDAMVVESLTNDRLREEIGDISRVPPSERLYGAGATPVMAAFTHFNPSGSRFSDGTYGVLYAGRDLKTALHETRYHRERFLKDSSQPPLNLEMREYRIDVLGQFRDLRGLDRGHPYLSASDYAHSQPFGVKLRESNENGIVYPSVRHAAGECVAAFSTRPLGHARQGRHYEYVWDGSSIVQIRELKGLPFSL